MGSTVQADHAPSPEGSANVPRALWKPLRLFARLLTAASLWMIARSRSHLLEPGEKMLALHEELEDDGSLWVASNRAVYIEPKPAKGRRGPIKTKRIPYEWIEDVSERRHGAYLEQRVRIAPRKVETPLYPATLKSCRRQS